VITPEQHVRIVVRPIASALPLGFFSFGLGMLLLAGSGNGWLPVSEQHTVGLLLAAFVAPVEFAAAIVAFLARDTFGATGLSLFSGSWFAIGLVALTSVPGELSRTRGLFEFGFAFAVAVLAVAAMLGKPLIGTRRGGALGAGRRLRLGRAEVGEHRGLVARAGHLRARRLRRACIPPRGRAAEDRATGVPTRQLEGVDRRHSA
jgi:hypothetical protein